MAFAKFVESHKKVLITAFLTVFIMLFIFQNVVFIGRDTLYKFTDHHIVMSMMYFDLVHGINISEWQQATKPPVMFLVSIPFHDCMGFSPYAARVSLSVFWIIFLLAMYGIGAHTGGVYAGIAVMALSAGSPHVLNYSRQYFSDFPQTATSALFLLFLLKSNFYRHRHSGIYSALFLSLALLTKWSAPFFILFPIIWLYLPNISLKKPVLTVNLFAISSVLLMTAGFFISFYKPEEIHWASCYLLLCLVPALAVLTACRFIEKALEKNEGNESDAEKIRGCLNFVRMTALCIIIIGPWYLWACRMLKGQFQANYGAYPEYYKNVELTVLFLKNCFSFAPILMAVGSIFIFLDRKNFHTLVLFPLALIISAFIMIKVNNQTERYILSLTIFACTMGGWWIGRAGRLRPYLAELAVIASVLSMLAWTYIPGDADIYQASPKRPPLIFSPVEPWSDSIDMNAGLREVIPADDKALVKIAVFQIRDFPQDREAIITSSYMRGLRVEIKYWDHFQTPEDMKRSVTERREEMLDCLNLCRYMIFMHSARMDISKYTGYIKALFPGRRFITTTRYAGDGQSLTVLEVKIIHGGRATDRPQGHEAY